MEVPPLVGNANNGDGRGLPVASSSDANAVVSPVTSEAATIRSHPEGHAEIPAEISTRTLAEQKARRSRVWIWVASLGALAALALFIGIGVSTSARGWKDRSAARFKDRLIGRTSRPEIKSLAVLPLDNLSGDPLQDYFADGMTDELITMLAKNTGLRVVSRTSVMQYKGVHRPLPDIARELHVDGILEGSIERSFNRVHMTVQLIYAPSDTHVWAESYDRDLNQAFLLPSELSQTIAKEVQAKTSSQPAPPLRYISPEAHEALSARTLFLVYPRRCANPTLLRGKRSSFSPTTRRHGAVSPTLTPKAE